MLKFLSLIFILILNVFYCSVTVVPIFLPLLSLALSNPPPPNNVSFRMMLNSK